jgi:paired amphipathic helix protein Sin3a
VPNYQAKLAFSDVDVIVDASRLLLTYAEHTHSGDFPKLTTFIKYFIPTYFGLDPDAFNERIRDVFDGSPSNGDMDDDTLMTADESPAQKGKKSNGKKTDLLRDVLGRGRKTAKEGSLPSSRASTPGIESNVDEEMTDATSDPLESDTSQKAWFVHATSGNSTKKREYKVNEPFKRTVYNMYANLTLYCFFRMFTILYERLHYMKISGRDVHDTIRKARTSKAAIELRMIDKTPDDFFTDTSANANYYTQMLQMFEDFLQGNGSMDMAHIEEILRRYYLKTGWMLYAFDKLLSALVRFAISVLNNDGKDKSSDIFQLFSKDRRKDMTTHQDELTYRRNVEKHIKEGEMYRIAFVSRH